jgi:hypothetical protein
MPDLLRNRIGKDRTPIFFSGIDAVSVDETKMKDGASRYGSYWGHDHRHDH